MHCISNALRVAEIYSEPNPPLPPPTPIKYLSLFSGIGGFEFGMERACKGSMSGNHTPVAENDNEQAANDNTADHDDDNATKQRHLLVCVGYSEIDKYANQIYKRHYPGHRNFGDITTIDERELPDFDLLVGGFPCQAFSIAGKRKGFIDTRGTLFFDIARIVRKKQPRLLLLENVKGLLSHDQGRTFTVIISTLIELGYDCQWQVLNSKDFGVPQNRERVYIIGHLRGTPRPEVFPFPKASGESVIQINAPRHSNDRVYGVHGICPTLNTMQGGNRQPFIAAERGRYTKSGSLSQRLEIRRDGISNTLTSVEKDNRLIDGLTIRRLTPTECERLQGFPDGWTEGVSATQRYKTLGNAVTVPVVDAIASKLLLAGGRA